MCPACWATLLASYGALLSVSALTIAATDRLVLPLAGALGVLSWMHAGTDVEVPWWCFASVGVALVARIGVRVVRARDDLLPVRAWRAAKLIATKRCPTKSLHTSSENR